MWLPVILFYTVINIKCIISIRTLNPRNEALDLADLFLENLKADPSLQNDYEISEKSKRFIDTKIDKFVTLVSQSQNAVFSRTKRSLDDKEYDISRYSINITSEKNIPTKYADDIRIFEHDSIWYAVSLEDKTKLALFKYENGFFKETLKADIKYTTNIGVISTEEFPLIIIGEIGKVLIFQFNPRNNKLQIVQMLLVDNPQHVVLWEQNTNIYLSVIDNLDNQTSTYTKDKISNIKIYKWMGRHFDLTQKIELVNIKKLVPFNIHGSYFLAAVNYRPHQDEKKSYSEIFKFDFHDTEFKPYQRVLTNGCTDIKYFTSKLHGEEYHFLVIVYTTKKALNESDLQNSSKSVIYKYEDQYFIPFQSIETNAVEWQPIQDLQANAALIAVTKDGLKGFQYDGWHFFESKIISDDYNLKFEETTALHTYYFEGGQILVSACDHCKNTTNIFKVSLSSFNAMKELHSQILSWCTNSLKDLESSKESDFVAESLRGDLNEQISLEEDQKRQLSAALRGSNEILINLEDLVEDSLWSNKTHIFDNDINAESVIFNNEVTFKSLQTSWFNDVNIDSLLDNVLDITDGFVLDNAPRFDVVVSQKALVPKIINDVPLERYIFLNENMTLNNLVVSGTVAFTNGVNIENMLNNVTVNNQSLLLKQGDQEFLGDMIIDDIIVHNLTAAEHHFDTMLNEKKVEVNINDVAINDGKVWNSQDQFTQTISHIKNLKVKNLDIGGLLNGVSVPVLEQHALKKSGDQILEKTLFVNALKVEKLNIGDKLSGKKVPDDFVMVNAGEYIVNQDVNFLKGLKVNKLEVLHSLNNITVTNDGELDVLLTDSHELQVIPTKKSFESLIITNPIKLRNKIQNAQMERINPVLIDGDSYNVDGDVTVEGLCEVRRWLRVEDLKGQEKDRSFRDVLEKGLKITDTQIPVSLTFTQPLDLDDTIADRVNLLNPRDWLLTYSDSPQVVTAQKTFLNDLYLEGPLNIFRINDVDAQRLQKDVLSVEGDQEIFGLLEVERVVANQGITSNNTFFGNNSWNPDLSIDQNQEVEEFSIINGNLKVNITRAKTLKVKGLINSLKISQTLSDVVRSDAKNKVFGQKIFKELHVDDLIIKEKESNLIKLLKDVGNNEITLDKNIDLNNNISVKNINFSHKFNNISTEDFGSMMNLKSVNNEITTSVTSDRYYDQITVYGEVFISDDFINGKNLSSIEEDTVKADEDYEFNKVRFGEAIFVQNSVHLEGDIENLDLNTIVKQNSNTTMEIQDKFFSENVFIDGTLNVEDTLNEIDLKKICEFSTADGNLKILKVEGDAIFVKGPKILNINGLSVADLLENLWFVDKEANISGSVRLQNTTFYNSINVEEFIDETNIKLLSQNYLSKSKDQDVLARLSFDDVTFANVATPKLSIKGPINGIILDDLLKSILLHNVTQIFESPAYFEEVRVQNLNEDTTYSVNDLNLKTDVMLYDAENVVTGRKIVNNISANRIKINHNTRLQDVDVLKWLSNAMLTNGSYSVTGKKIFKDVTFKQGLSLRGNVNGQEFNEKTVMLVDTPQNITGKKSFVSHDEDVTKFKILRIKGLINNMELESFVQNQSNKGQNNILNSEMIFNNSIAVKNINIDVIYNDVNVTELLHNITTLGAMEHFQEKYEHLLDMSLVVESSVKGQESFFKYFKEILYLDHVYDVFGLKCKDGLFRLLTFSFRNGTNIFITFEWNVFKKEFIHLGENVESYFMPNFMEQVSIGDKDYVYIEHHVASIEKPYGQSYFGQLSQLINSTTFEPVASFQTNGTKSLISFVPPGLNQPCLGFIDIRMSGMRIFCDESGNRLYSEFQTILMENVYKATTVRTPDYLYLFLARQGLPFQEPSIVVFESFIGSPQFKEKQIIFEGADLNGLAAAVIGNVPHVAFSFGPREATIGSGRVSLRKFDPSTQQFVQWQHIPLSAPLGAHFVTDASFEPLLIAPSADTSAPLQILRYHGCAGFEKSLKGAALSPKSRIRIIYGGNFLVALQDDRNTGVILGAVVKGLVRN